MSAAGLNIVDRSWVSWVFGRYLSRLVNRRLTLHLIADWLSFAGSAEFPVWSPLWVN